MEPHVKNIVERLKTPVITCTLQNKIKSTPNLLSHIGGIPYAEKGARVPVCRSCRNAMSFIFQVHSHEKEEDSTLFCFYYCLSCNLEIGNHGFRIQVFHNPSLAKLVKHPSRKSPIPYAEFIWDVHWSFPEWGSLPFVHQKAQDSIVEIMGEEAEVSYDFAVEELLLDDVPPSIHETDPMIPAFVDTYSFFGGYPKFLGFPNYPTCGCCQHHMELFMQLDTSTAHRLIWAKEGCLYIFRCPTNLDQFSILIQ